MGDPATPTDPTETGELTDDDLDALDPEDEIGGDAASHPEFLFPSVFVGPATSDQFNTIEEWIRPVACWRLDDTRFEFDSSFVKPGAARELRMLIDVRTDHPNATLSLFGQADPVGSHDYNKALSGRRARAVYGMLTRNADIWEQLFKQDPKCPGDVWGKPSLETMLTTVGRPAEDSGKLANDAEGRKALYLQYMEKLCGPKLKLDPKTDFLARGGDANLRGDVQGCSEFNAIMRFSASENAKLSQASKKAERDTENAPNRRVVAFLFSKDLLVDPGRWPCPAATEGVTKCNKRLFVDHEKRRANQANRRTFADDKNTFECRFYHRLAIQSPCETSLLTSLQRIRVRLVLEYLDPMGKTHPFPKGYRVSALCPDGTTRNARVGDGGKVRFVIDRPKLSFILEFDSSDNLYFGNAAPGSKATPVDKLILEDDVDEAIRQGYRVFKVPHQWSTRDSDWVTVDSPLYVKDKGEFAGIENPGTIIGTADAPVKMVLDPHWQFLRWEYFDRILLKKLPCPPMIVEGFDLAELAFGEPDTRSNWTTDGNKNQALPWIIRDESNRPNGEVLIQLNTGDKRAFIETKGGASKIVTVDEGGGPDTVKASVVDTPSVERMNFYDLPQIWKSRGYFTRIGAAGDAFEKAGVNKASDGQPITFSLDDVVLVDDHLAPIAWNPTNDRVAIFSHKLHKGIQASLHRPDGALPYISQVPTLVKDRNYLADYPDWTRLIAMRGSLYDIFDRRLPDSDTSVVGARAGVRWADGASSGGAGNPRQSPALAPAAGRTVTAVQIGIIQNHEFVTGRNDQASLRCCDVEGGTEIGVNLHYLRMNFRFNPPQPAPPAAARVANTIANQQGWVNAGVANVTTRWNGPDGAFNKGNIILVPAKGGPLRMHVVWFMQVFPHPLTAAFNNAEAQFTIDVWKSGRAFMRDSNGTGEITENENQAAANGRFTMAHECGHGDSLADEYLENSMDASYRQPGYREYLPGGPFLRDTGDSASIMRGNIEVRGRHFWHAAEWMRSVDGTEYAVKYDGLTYSLPSPFPAAAPVDTFATVPLVPAPDVRSGNGFFNCWLYRLGKDKFSVSVLKNGPFDGFLSVNVRIKCTFLDASGNQITSHTDLVDFASKIFNAVRDQMGGKFFATGTANGVTFSKVFIDVFPRLLVVNNSGNANYLAGLDNPTGMAYGALVTNIETRRGPTHFNVNFIRQGPTNIAPNAAGAGTLNFNMKDLDLTDDFPMWFAGMLGINVAPGAIKQAANYVP